MVRRTASGFVVSVRRTLIVLTTGLGLIGSTADFGVSALAAAGVVNCPSVACPVVGRDLGFTAGVAASGGHVYVTNPDGTLFEVTPATSVTRVVASGLGNLRGVAIGGDDAYAVDFDGTLHRVDLITGADEVLASDAFDSDAQGVAYASGTVYVTSGTGTLYSLPATGGVAPLPVATGLGIALGVSLDGAGHADVADAEGRVAEVTLAGGAVRVVSDSSDLGIPSGIADSNGAAIVVNSGDVLSVDLATGRITDIAKFHDPSPDAVAVDGVGHAFVNDGNDGTVVEVGV